MNPSPLPLWTPPPGRPVRVACLGAHPDDPECCCGGTLFSLACRGHRVTAVYLTRGERGISGADDAQAARIRSAEAEAACRRLGIVCRFAGLIDSIVGTDAAAYAALLAVVAPLDPDIVLAHWPIDAHSDHQAAGVLAQRLMAGLGGSRQLWFFPAMLGYQSRNFTPTHAVDVSDPACQDAKREALGLHRSQQGEVLYTRHHRPMDEACGRQSGVALAEAYALQEVGIVEPS